MFAIGNYVGRKALVWTTAAALAAAVPAIGFAKSRPLPAEVPLTGPHAHLSTVSAVKPASKLHTSSIRSAHRLHASHKLHSAHKLHAAHRTAKSSAKPLTHSTSHTATRLTAKTRSHVAM